MKKRVIPKIEVDYRLVINTTPIMLKESSFQLLPVFGVIYFLIIATLLFSS